MIRVILDQRSGFGFSQRNGPLKRTLPHGFTDRCELLLKGGMDRLVRDNKTRPLLLVSIGSTVSMLFRLAALPQSPMHSFCRVKTPASRGQLRLMVVDGGLPVVRFLETTFVLDRVGLTREIIFDLFRAIAVWFV